MWDEQAFRALHGRSLKFMLVGSQSLGESRFFSDWTRSQRSGLDGSQIDILDGRRIVTVT